jgi:hypothetical protein
MIERLRLGADRADREASARAGTVTSARDEIWIDMVQFDVSAADRLWEGIPPAHGAPEWYDDVSGLIETASGPAEPHELVDEPVVVDHMHKTTLGRPCRCRHGRTLGRLVAMKAAAATTTTVLGVAAAAAATTGIVATMASVVVPAIEEHVLLTDDDQEAAVPAAPRSRESGGASDTRPERQPNDLAAAPPAAPAPPASPQPADPEPAMASASPAATAPTAETGAAPADQPPPAPVVAEPAPPPDPGGGAPTPPPPTEPAPAPAPPAHGALDDPAPADPPSATDPLSTDPAPPDDPPTEPSGGAGRIESASSGPEPAKPPRVVEPPATDPPPATEPPRRDAQPDKSRRWSDGWADPVACARHACPGRGHHHDGGELGHRGTRAEAVAELVGHARPAHPRRPG